MRPALAMTLSVALLGLAEHQPIDAPDPTDPVPLAARQQVRWLDGRIDGRAARLAAIFPEGELFTWEFWALSLLNIAEASHRPDDVERAVGESRKALEAMDALLTHAPFSRMKGWALRGGICWFAGQHLVRERLVALLGSQATEDERLRLARDEAVLARAFAESPSGVLEAHPDFRYPVDSLFALEAMQLHDRQFATHDFPPAWAKYARTTDASMGASHLPASLIDAQGGALDVPRGCALSWTLLVLPRLDPARAKAQWAAYRRHFFSCDGVPCLVREYPRGVERPADPDSGPMVMGYGMAATGFALGAARANGDRTIERRLEQTGDLLGAPVVDRAGRRYLGGAMPLADVLALYVRTVAAPAAWE